MWVTFTASQRRSKVVWEREVTVGGINGADGTDGREKLPLMTFKTPSIAGDEGRGTRSESLRARGKEGVAS